MQRNKNYLCQLKGGAGVWESVAYFLDIIAAERYVARAVTSDSSVIAGRIKNTLTDKTEYEIVKSN